ncbi:MAG: hypothetical protein J6A94_13065 [Lachnospiraceae bacterium]|nr:hypothetical protein [Lachnospiraceae bacterium]
MESICMEQELSIYNLEGKWNDYIGVQKEILQVLREQNYFEQNEVVNTESNIAVRITSKGIRETIGNGNRFQTLPKKLKQFKVATIRYLPELIKTGYIIDIDAVNSHDEAGYRYAYIGNEIAIDDKKVGVRISIKKKVGSNHFWIHNIDEK